MNPESDEEFEAAPRVNKSTPYARSTHSSASKTFGAGDDDIDDEVNFKDAGSAGKGGDDSVPSPTVVDDAEKEERGGAVFSLRAMLSEGTGLRVSGASGLLESLAALVAVPGTALHSRIEKKSNALIGSLAMLVKLDPDFKLVCSKFAEVFESLKGAGLKSAVLKFLDSLQDTFDLTDDQAAMCVLLTATAALRKRADKSKPKAALTLRVVGSCVSAAAGCEMDDRIKLIAAGQLVGDLTGGDRSNLSLFKTPSALTLRLFVAWVEHLSRMSEHDSSLAEERKKFFMIDGVQHNLWQQVVDRRLEHILLCWARFNEAKQDFARFQAILNVQLLPSDVYGLMKLFWPAMHPEFVEELKAASRMWSVAGKSIAWLEGIPVFQSFERLEADDVRQPCYKDFFEMAWDLWTANGDRQVSRVNPRQPAIAPAALPAARRPGQPAADPKKDGKRNCFHFKKHGSCKFGGDEGCRNGAHPAEFKVAGGLPAPMPKSVIALPAGVVVGDDAVVRECRLCKKNFTESQNEWFVEKKLEAMPWHCEACRKIRHEQRRVKAAEVAAIVVSQSPADLNTSAEAPAAAAPSGFEQPTACAPCRPAPSAQPAGFSADAWDEVIKFGDAEEDFAFMIADSSVVSNALEDIACLYDESDDDIDDLQVADAHYVKKIFASWVSSHGVIESINADNSPNVDGESDLEDADQPEATVCSPSWASLDAHNLAAQSMSVKTKFDGDAMHDDRIRVHQGVDRSVQLCITDSQGRLMAIPSEDGIEICLPGMSLDGSFDLDMLMSMLYEQTSLDVEITQFQYCGWVDLCDDFGDKKTWYYFEVSVSDALASTASDDEGNAVSWLEPWQWRNMDVFRAAEACCFFDLKAASEHRGFVVDPLSSDEFNHAMVSSSSDEEEDDAVAQQSARRRNRFILLESSDEDDGDDLPYESVAIPSADGQGETLAELNAPCKYIDACKTPDSCDFEDANLWSKVLSEVGGGGDADTLWKFGQVLPLVLQHAVIQDFQALIYFKSRSWSVRQPSAKKVIRKILADKELRTPVKVVETLAKMVPSAVELTRTGVAPDLLASVLAVNHEDDRLFQDFQEFDYEVVVAASLDLSSIVVEKQIKFAAAELSGVSSQLSLVCSGLRSDIKAFAEVDELMASARKIGVPKQLTLRECISRASESVMFADPSYRFVRSLKSGGTALDQVSYESMPFFGVGSAEPHQ